jgi:hypothetical protein
MSAIRPTTHHRGERLPRGGDTCGPRALLRGPHVLLLLLALLAAATLPPHAQADGGFVSPYRRDVLEPSQKAIILFDDKAKLETLIIQPSFRAFTPDFAWIVPVPALPELDTAESALFIECSDLTQPLQRRRGGGGCSSFDPVADTPPPGNGGVSVHDQRTVGIYRTLTISASDAGVLTDSLDTWGYLHSENRAATAAALSHYVERSWFFVAMRVDSTRFWRRDSKATPWIGDIDPIRFTFAAEQVIYPMRLSAISAADWTSVLLYVCAEHRMTFDGASTEYAHRLNTFELSVMRDRYPNLAALLARPCFMTKLRHWLAPHDMMMGDIILTRADDDREYRRIRYYGDMSLGGGLLAALIACLVRARRRRRAAPLEP